MSESDDMRMINNTAKPATNCARTKPLKLAGAVALLAAMLSYHSNAAPNYTSCQRVNAYWNTNLNTLKDNISACTVDGLWHKCSQAAAIHYDLAAGSLGQRAKSCGLEKPAIPGDDYTTPSNSDSRRCLNARNDLREAFENRALARLACAAARVGGDNQQWLDSQCLKFRARLSNYHHPFRQVAQHCELDNEQTVALNENN